MNNTDTDELEEFLSSQEESDIQKFHLEDRYGDGYQVILRFRNQKDYFQFVDLIGQPKLKVYSKQIMRETDWPIKIHENSLFD